MAERLLHHVNEELETFFVDVRVDGILVFKVEVNCAI